MKTLVVGNSHIVGLRSAIMGTKKQLTYVPSPLCSNFEEAVVSGHGQFKINAGWNIMSSDLSQESTTVTYNLSQRDTKLVMVGMKLFSAYPIFTPLIMLNSDRKFIICIKDINKSIPYHKNYQLVSESCLRHIIKDTLYMAVKNYYWLLKNFQKAFWIPAPPTQPGFAREKFREEHKWIIESGAQATYLRICNECIEETNKLKILPLDITFLKFPQNGIDDNTGFLLESYAFKPRTSDIHASSKYYDQIIDKVIESGDE
jgi:hypothetical protein